MKRNLSAWPGRLNRWHNNADQQFSGPPYRTGFAGKKAMNGAMEATIKKILAKELSPQRVNAVSPGLADTEA